jgi:PAS domain S-box-containing protein
MTTTNILIVEDERIIAKGIEKQLKGMGYAVAGFASTGEEGVQKAVELQPDLVLIDIHLGSGIDGIEAAGRIRNRVGIPVVYLTAHSDNATLQRAKLTEPFGYVLKPYEDKDLQTAIEIGLYKHKMDRRLREDEQWLAATLASIGDGVIATDEQGRVRFMNSLAEQFTGWTQTDAIGRDMQEVFHIVGEKTRQPIQNPALEAMEKGKIGTLAKNSILIDKNGTERPIDDSAAPIRDVSGKVSGSVLVFRDITERRRLEEHLRQAQKMEAIGRLAGGIAHDFNSMMTIIIGYSELLLTTSRPAAETVDMVRHIHDAGKRSASLTQQIMAFSRNQILIPSVLNLNTVLRDMKKMVKRLIGSNIELITEMASDLGQVKADPTQIGQVILNLAANARDAMPNSSGGRLLFATANVELDEMTSRNHPDVKSGRYAMLSVSDTGSGMSKEVLAQVFEPFFTTKGAGQGTGLGLSTVYGIVKQSGGHIEVSSRIGEGTMFKVYLPLVEETAPTPESHETCSAANGHETILLVEEEEALGAMIKMILMENGYNVLGASNGVEGLEMAESHQGVIHLLMTDLVMPKLSGREMAERLKLLNPGLRVLFMSGYTEDMIVPQVVESASSKFLTKPFGLAALTKKIRELLDCP